MNLMIRVPKQNRVGFGGGGNDDNTSTNNNNNNKSTRLDRKSDTRNWR